MATASEMGEEACLGLLAGATSGRIGYSARALPRITPVGLSLEPSGCIRAHLQRDEDKAGPIDGAIVAVEADGMDDEVQRAWSVHVVGRVTRRSGPDLFIEPGVIDGGWLDL